DIDNNRITFQEIASNVTSDYFTFHISDPSGNTTGDFVFLFQITSVTPTVHGIDFSVVENGAVAATSLFTLSNPSNDSITTYALWDDGIGNGYFILDGIIQPVGQWIYVNASNLSDIRYVGGLRRAVKHFSYPHMTL